MRVKNPGFFSLAGAAGAGFAAGAAVGIAGDSAVGAFCAGE